MKNEHYITKNRLETQNSGESSKNDLDTLEELSTTLKGNRLPLNKLKNASLTKLKKGKIIFKISLESFCLFCFIKAGLA